MSDCFIRPLTTEEQATSDKWWNDTVVDKWLEKTAKDAGITEEELRVKLAKLYRQCTSDDGWTEVTKSPIVYVGENGELAVLISEGEG